MDREGAPNEGWRVFRGEMKSGFVRRREPPRRNINFFSFSPSASGSFDLALPLPPPLPPQFGHLPKAPSPSPRSTRLRRVCRPIGKFSNRKKLSNQLSLSPSLGILRRRERVKISLYRVTRLIPGHSFAREDVILRQLVPYLL